MKEQVGEMGHRLENMQDFIKSQERDAVELKEQIQIRDETIRHLEQNLIDS